MDVIAGTAFGLKVESQHNFDEPFVNAAKKFLSNVGRNNWFFIIFSKILSYTLDWYDVLIITFQKLR